MKTKHMIGVAAMVAATILGGCSANLQMASENATLRAKLAEREREEAKLREELLAPGGATAAPAATATPTADAKPAATGAPATAVAAAPPRVAPPPAFQRGGTVGPGVGYINRDPMDGRPCGGMCLELRNRSPYYMLVLIDSREMTVFAGYEAVVLPVNGAKLGGGRHARTASLVPPGEVVKTAMDSVGNHQIRVVFYTAIPGQPFLQPVGIWDMTEKFPYAAFGQSYAWGRYQGVYGPSREIGTY
ncbi:MAG TPA: hypothetical protein VN397_03270 [Candidatus Methylomirabilis sp.]|nr:hypothetical protein [Candidatus Methylomirabilis sp.]